VFVKARTFAAVVLMLLCAAPAFPARTILYYENECCREITEGEFAILYAQGMKLREPVQGWTVQSAAAALSSLGHQPGGGWVLSRFLSEKVMSRLLTNSPFYRKPFTEESFQRSELTVTVSKARSVFPPDEGITQGEFAILLAEALRLSPPGIGWKAETAIAALTSQPVPLRPPGGWKGSEILKEGDFLQILAPTQYKPVPVNPASVITTLQAYSLLFGSFEIATQGDFGLFLVNALGATPPPGGWTKVNSLEYVKREFNLENGYGWNPSAPLCTEVFEDALRVILTRAQPAVGKPAKNQPDLEDSNLESSAGPFVPSPGQARAVQAAPSQDAEILIRQIRGSGLIPLDRCAIIPAQGLLQLPTIRRPLPDLPASSSEPTIPPETK
jgi:hypothetical protein